MSGERCMPRCRGRVLRYSDCSTAGSSPISITPTVLCGPGIVPYKQEGRNERSYRKQECRMNMKRVIETINEAYPISSETEQALKDSVTECHFPKRYQLVKAGAYSKCAYFIEEGMTRSFWLVNGEEITTSFSYEGGIVFSMDELYYNKVSEEFVETLEDVVAYRALARTVSHQYRVGQLGTHYPSKRISAVAPFAQRAPHPVGRRSV